MMSIIYVRVSTQDQADFGYSLKEQERLCIEYEKEIVIAF